MNEVSSMRGVNNMPISPASSTGAVNGNQNTKQAESGKQLPPTDELKGAQAAQSSLVEDKPAQEAPTSPMNLDDAVASMNSFVQTVQRDLQFTVDEELDKTVVKVLDSETGDVIRQIPEQTFLELARNMKEHGVLRLVDATG